MSETVDAKIFLTGVPGVGETTIADGMGTEPIFYSNLLPNKE